MSMQALIAWLHSLRHARPARVALAFGVMLYFALIPGATLVSLPPFAPSLEEPEEISVPASDRIGKATLHVKDEQGRPLAGAVVRALLVKEGMAFGAGKAVSGDDGVAVIERLPIGPHWFVADAPSRARVSAPRFVGPDPVDLEMRLPPARALFVEVRDDAGTPLPGVSLEIHGDGPLPRGSKTGRDGNALPTGLGAGPLRIIARAPGWDEAQVTTTADARRVRIGMRRLGAMRILVVDTAGKPIPGAEIAIAGGALGVARTTIADAEGRARVAGLGGGSYDLRASKGNLVSNVEIGVSLPRGGEIETKLVLLPGRRIAVRVVDDLGSVVPGVDIVILEGFVSPFPIEGKTDARGTVDLGPIARAPAALHAFAEGWVPRGPVDLGTEETTPSAPKEITLRRAGTLVVEARDARGGAVDGATLEVVGTDLDGQPIDVTPTTLAFRSALHARAPTGRALVPMGELGVVPGPVPPIPRAGATRERPSADVEPWVTGADGVVRGKPVPPGRVRAIVRHPAYVEALSALVDLPAGGEARVTVTMSAGGHLSGRVLDDRGHVLAGAVVEVAARHGTLTRAIRTGSDGAYSIVALPGEVTVSVSPPDRPYEVALRVDAAVPEGGATTLDLQLPAPRDACKVSVRDDRRYPIKGAQVTISSLDPAVPFKATAFTDEHGDAQVARAATINAQLEVRAPGRATHRQSFPSVPTSVDVELAAGIVVRGVVYTPYGRGPQSSATVSLFADGGTRRATTDGDGRFSFADVAPGEATIEVRAAGTAGQKKTVTVAATGSRGELDVGRIELDPAGGIEGTVVDERGHAIIGARVARDHAPTWVPSSGPGPGVAVTDGLGAFKLADLPLGEVDLEAYAADVGRGRSGRVRVDEGRTRSGVVIVLKPLAASVGGDDLTPGGVAVTLGEADGKVSLLSVAPGSEAERAGLRANDEVETIDGVIPSSLVDARARLGGPLGVDTILIVRRGATSHSIRVTREAIKR